MFYGPLKSQSDKNIKETPKMGNKVTRITKMGLYGEFILKRITNASSLSSEPISKYGAYN